jgi:hypothetical protein
MCRGVAQLMYQELKDTYDFKKQHVKISACVGTSCHAAAALDLEAIMRKKERPTEKELIDFAVENLKTQLQDDVDFDNTTQSIPQAIQQTRAITALHYNAVAPTSDPVLVEQRLSAEIEDVILTGQPDSIEKNGTIRDIKTGVKRNYILQHAGYSILAKAHGIRVSGAETIHIPRAARDKKTELYVYKTSGDVLKFGVELAVFKLLKKIKKEVDSARAGNMITNVNPASALCDAQYCPAYATPFCIATFSDAKKIK